MSTVLLEGVVGSTAYGLATPESDVDYLGIFAAPTESCFKIFPPKQTIVSKDPDRTLHEVRKYVELAIQCNPTVLELLWLNSYTVSTDAGEELVQIRRAFLSQKRVRDAYFGYATQQFKRAERHTETETEAERRAKVAKNARHLYRLLEQGEDLWCTGGMNVRVFDPETVHAFGEKVAAGEFAAMHRRMQEAERIFDTRKPKLPSMPNLHQVEMWLLNVRIANLSGSHIGNDYDEEASSA